MCVGMNRCEPGASRIEASVPHVRGDEPITAATIMIELTRSPCAWG